MCHYHVAGAALLDFYVPGHPQYPPSILIGVKNHNFIRLNSSNGCERQMKICTFSWRKNQYWIFDHATETQHNNFIYLFFFDGIAGDGGWWWRKVWKTIISPFFLRIKTSEIHYNRNDKGISNLEGWIRMKMKIKWKKKKISTNFYRWLFWGKTFIKNKSS